MVIIMSNRSPVSAFKVVKEYHSKYLICFERKKIYFDSSQSLIYITTIMSMSRNRIKVLSERSFAGLKELQVIFVFY